MHAQFEDRHVEQESSMDAGLEQSSVVVTDMDALHTEQSIDIVVHDTSMRDRQVERSCSSETRQEIVVQESMHGEIEQVSSTDAQLCVSLADDQEIQKADLPSQSVSTTDSDCIGVDSSVM